MKPLNPKIHGQATAPTPGTLVPHKTTIGVAIFLCPTLELTGYLDQQSCSPKLPNAVLDVEQTPTGGDQQACDDATRTTTIKAPPDNVPRHSQIVCPV
jgi:hypothetical protein